MKSMAMTSTSICKKNNQVKLFMKLERENKFFSVEN